MIKVLLIGFGGMGHVHFAEYKKMDNCELCAIADVDEKKRTEAENEGIKAYADFKEAIEKERPDAVDICTPSYMHKDMSVYAMEHGCNVLCEKPMALTAADCEEMKSCAEKTGKKLMIAHVVRFMKAYVYLKNVIKDGSMGKLVRLDMRRMSQMPEWSWEHWMKDITKNGGSLFDLIIHDIDYVQSVCGEPKDISAIYKITSNVGGNNDISLQFVYDDFAVTFGTGFYSTALPFEAGFLAVFENGYIRKDGDDFIVNGEKIALDDDSQIENVSINIKGADGYGAEIAYFIDCVQNDKPIEAVTPQSSATTVRIAEKIKNEAIYIK